MFHLKVSIQVLIAVIWFQHEKCIQMSTNMPSIVSEIREKASGFFRKKEQ